MLTSFRTNKVFAWSMMVILIAAMAGFGLGGVLSGGQVTHVARVGDERISVERFVTAFRERQRQVSQQIGQPLSTIEARQFGLGNVVIGELVRDAVLTAEAKELGLGISDEIIQRSLLSQPAFQSITGGFDPEMYEFALQNADLTTGQYEAQLRDQAQRELVGTALASGVAIPQAAIDQILAYTGEARSFTTVRLSLEVFLDEVTAPSDEQLATFLADNPSLFEVPETRDVVYAALLIERLAESIDIPLSEVEPIYEADRARFQTPERRAVDRISFPSRADAETALQQLSDGTLTVAQIAQDRGLTPQDLTLGLVTPSDLPRAEREAVFGAESVGIIGPIETDLGPVLFVINAVLAAQETPRDEALDTLRAELAFEEAQDLAIEDLLRAEELVAGGATVEEIVETTAFELAQAEVTAFGATGPHADVVPFRDAAMAADLGLETDPIETEDGIFILRVDGVTPPTVPALEDIREAVESAWRRGEAATLAHAAADAALIDARGAVLAVSETYSVEPLATQAVTRDRAAAGLSAAAFETMFALETPGEARVFTDPAGATLARLDAIIPVDPDQVAQLSEFVALQQAQGLQQDVIAYLANARATERGLSIDSIAIDQLLSQLP